MQSKDEIQDLPQEEVFLELRELVARAKQGDRAIVPQLKEYLRKNPQVWQRIGDLALQSQAAWIRLVAGRDKHLQECIVAKVNDMKMELADENTSTLENLLVERVISTWLQLYYHEAQSAQGEEKSLRWAEFRLKQLTAASDRHVKAIGALATLKKLLPSGPKVLEQPATEAPPEKRNGQGRSPAQPADQPQPTNGRVNGHGANRVAALLNGKAVATRDS